MKQKIQSAGRVNSPQALDQYIRVSSGAVWIVMAILIVVLAAAVIWGVLGTVDAVDAAGNVKTVHPIEFVTN